MIINDSCLNVLDRIDPVTMIFADPPDNLGLNYNGFEDSVRPEHYYNMIELLILKSLRVAKIFWLSYYHEHDLEIKYIVRNVLKYRHPSWKAKGFLWVYTFGQYNANDCASGYRPILRLTSPDAKLYPEQIRVTSERMLMGDKRAAGLRTPDNVWEFPRVVGNSSERRAWHPTQHPEKLLERIVLFSTPPSGIVYDAFGGSGTMLRVCKRLGRPCVVSEISEYYCEQMSIENK